MDTHPLQRNKPIYFIHHGTLKLHTCARRILWDVADKKNENDTVQPKRTKKTLPLIWWNSPVVEASNSAWFNLRMAIEANHVFPMQ